MASRRRDRDSNTAEPSRSATSFFTLSEAVPSVLEQGAVAVGVTPLDANERSTRREGLATAASRSDAEGAARALTPLEALGDFAAHTTAASLVSHAVLLRQRQREAAKRREADMLTRAVPMAVSATERLAVPAGPPGLGASTVLYDRLGVTADATAVDMTAAHETNLSDVELQALSRPESRHSPLRARYGEGGAGAVHTRPQRQQSARPLRPIMVRRVPRDPRWALINDERDFFKPSLRGRPTTLPGTGQPSPPIIGDDTPPAPKPTHARGSPLLADVAPNGRRSGAQRPQSSGPRRTGGKAPPQRTSAADAAHEAMVLLEAARASLERGPS